MLLQGPAAGPLEQLASALSQLWPGEGVESALAAVRRAAAGAPELPELWEELRRALARSPAAVVHGVPVEEDALLLALTMGLGTPSAVGNGSGIFHEVRPKPLEEQGDVSTTRDEFLLHTDSTALVEPHDIVCLACVEAEPDGGGESLVVRVDAVVAELRERRPESLNALAEAVFPFPLNDPVAGTGIHEVPVLTATSGRHAIRYRADTLALGLAARPDALSPEHREALEALDEVLADPPDQASYLMRPGDVLFVDNRHAFHGRTKIRAGAARHLRRLKLYAAPD